MHIKPRTLAPRTKRRAAIACLSLSTAIHALASPPAAIAVNGFTTGDKSTNPFFYDGNADTSLSSWTLTDPADPSWACIENNPKACVEFTASPVTVVLLGNTNPDVTTTWTSATGAGLPDPQTKGYLVSFSGTFDTTTPGETGTYATYLIGSTESDVLESSFSFDNIFVPFNQTLTFKITNVTGDGGSLTINSFSYNEPVPAPIPAAGAATAFGYSRRLRRRIQGMRPAGSCPPLQPAHPAAYLNLTTASLESVPVSFSYASQTIVTDRSKMAA